MFGVLTVFLRSPPGVLGDRHQLGLISGANWFDLLRVPLVHLDRFGCHELFELVDPVRVFPSSFCSGWVRLAGWKVMWLMVACSGALGCSC